MRLCLCWSINQTCTRRQKVNFDDGILRIFVFLSVLSSRLKAIFIFNPCDVLWQPLENYFECSTSIYTQYTHTHFVHKMRDKEHGIRVFVCNGEDEGKSTTAHREAANRHKYIRSCCILSSFISLSRFPISNIFSFSASAFYLIVWVYVLMFFAISKRIQIVNIHNSFIKR